MLSAGSVRVKPLLGPGMSSVKSKGVLSAGVASLTMTIVPVSRELLKVQVTVSSASRLIDAAPVPVRLAWRRDDPPARLAELQHVVRRAYAAVAG